MNESLKAPPRLRTAIRGDVLMRSAALRGPRLAVMGLVLWVLSSCVPMPHTTPRSDEARGRVLDAATRAPIQGARIFLTKHPGVSCESDSEGYFRLKKTRNFHFAVIPPDGRWPYGEFWEPHVTVAHRKYSPRRLDDDFLDKGEVLLEPKK